MSQLVQKALAYSSPAAPGNGHVVIAATLPYPVTAGNMLLVELVWDDQFGGAGSESISDNKSNNWFVVPAAPTQNNIKNSMYYALSAVAGSTTVSATYTTGSGTTPGNHYLAVYEYSGVTAFDTSSYTQSGTAPISTSLTTGSANELLHAWIAASSINIAATESNQAPGIPPSWTTWGSIQATRSGIDMTSYDVDLGSGVPGSYTSPGFYLNNQLYWTLYLAAFQTSSSFFYPSTLPLVQSSSASAESGVGSPISRICTFPFGNTAGHGLVIDVVVQEQTIGGGTISVTDSNGNVYSAVGPPAVEQGNVLCQTFYCNSCVGDTGTNPDNNRNTVTAHYTGAGYIAIAIHEYNITLNGVDTFTSGGNTGNTVIPLTINPTTYQCLLHAWGGGSCTTLNPVANMATSTGWSMRENMGSYNNQGSIVGASACLVTADKPLANPGSYSSTITPGATSNNSTAYLIAFKNLNAPVPPTLSSISPTSGPTAGGTSITLTGTGFVSGATATVGGNPATGVVFNSSTNITVVTPPGSAGTATVVVTNPSGLGASLPNAFLYIAPPPPTPTILSITPTSGPTVGGTSVTITGTNFASGASVTFGSIPATSVVVVNATTITAITPPSPAGSVDVVVTNLSGQTGSLISGFTYTAPLPGIPTIISIAPNNGPTTGGTLVTISGSNFTPGIIVTFGTVSVAGATVINSNTLTVLTPPGSVGGVTVMVSNGSGITSLPNGFTYTAVEIIPPPVAPPVATAPPRRIGSSPTESLPIGYYLDLFTSEYRRDKLFLQWCYDILKIADDISNCMMSITEAFDLDHAIGVQLDTLGVIVGASRTLPFQPSGGLSPVLDDDTFRILIKATIANNQWDGTIGSLYPLWQELFSGGQINIEDNQDMSANIIVTGAFNSLIQDMILHDMIVPRPEGVEYNFFLGNLPFFGFDRDDAFVAGFDVGKWG